LGIFLGLLGTAVLFLTNFVSFFLQGEAASLLRPLIWWDVIRMGLQAPIFGLGPVIYMYLWKDPSFFSITFQQAHVYAWTRATFSPPSHNLYVDIFAQTGLVGTFFFLWLLAAAGRFGWRFHTRFSPGFDSAYVHAVFAGFVAMAISSAPFADWLIPFVYNIGIGGFSQSMYTWLLFGTLVSMDHNNPSSPNGK
jgi:O-antigen ligase